MEAAPKRLAGRFEAQVEAVRVGYVTARDRKLANRWKAMKGRQRMATRGSGRGLTGEALERRVMALGVTHPEYVVVEAAA